MNGKLFKKNRKIKLSVVIARYYLDHKKLEYITNKFLENLDSNNYVIEKDIIFVDLKNEDKASKENSKYCWKDKEPYFFDFSAYQEIKKTSDSDLFLYINDTLFIKHPWKVITNKIRNLFQTLASIDDPAAIGIVYPYSEALMIDSKNPNLKHMTTFCFVLNKAANKIFNGIMESLDECMNKEDWVMNKINSNRFISYLLNIHLYGPISPWSWKNNNNFPDNILLSKAISVILEYELNQSILNANGLIIPIPRNFKYLISQKYQTLIGKIKYRKYF